MYCVKCSWKRFGLSLLFFLVNEGINLRTNVFELQSKNFSDGT